MNKIIKGGVVHKEYLVGELLIQTRTAYSSPRLYLSNIKLIIKNCTVFTLSHSSNGMDWPDLQKETPLIEVARALIAGYNIGRKEAA